MNRFLPLMIIILSITACTTPGAENPSPPPLLTPAAGTVPNDSTPLPEPPTLVLLTHDSFSISESVLQAFETQSGARVEVLRAGDAGSMLNQAILSKEAPLADLIFGVDNTFLSRALAADILAPYASPYLAAIPEDLQLDREHHMLPVDYGYVTINYDRAALAAAGRRPPASLEELARPEWRGQLVVQNPATSSPGLAFLLATIGYFGEESGYSWQDYWRDLRANEVYISPDWSDAYYTQFSGSSGQGPYPLVVSYATSPAAEVFFSEGKLSEPPTGNLLPPGGSFLQIEFVGILSGTRQRALAEQFIDFMLQPTFQNDIPLQMFVYPASRDATLPDLFRQFAEVPAQTAPVTPEQIEQNRERWINEWTEIVLR